LLPVFHIVDMYDIDGVAHGFFYDLVLLDAE
jgi:hypothetical protein